MHCQAQYIKKMSKKIKKDKVSPENAIIPACDVFCNPQLTGEAYKWTGWGLAILHLRQYGGLDQAVFGRLLRGYTRGQISRYETEATEPPIDFWIKMARTFGLNITWALTGHGTPYITDYQDCEERSRFYEWIVLIADKENFLRDLRGS